MNKKDVSEVPTPLMQTFMNESKMLPVSELEVLDNKRKRERLINTLSLRETMLLKALHDDHVSRKSPGCLICHDSSFEMDVCSLLEKKRCEEEKSHHHQEMILEENIISSAAYHEEPVKPKKENDNLLFKTFYTAKVPKDVGGGRSTYVKERAKTLGGGVTCYQLSDPMFINNGWTMLPTEKIVRKINIYKMRPSQPRFDWFSRNKSKGTIMYDSGQLFAEFREDGTAQCYYRNGKLALDYYQAAEQHAQKRYVVYSNGDPDKYGRARPLTVLAAFDYLGSGIVFDHHGETRLKYNQTEGAVLDKTIGPITRWKWHSLNDPPVLQRILIDTQPNYKEPEILAFDTDHKHTGNRESDEMHLIEFDNFVRHQNKKMKLKFKPYQIKMKALKINEYFSLRILDQATIYLIYRDGTTSLKLNIGMILDPKNIIDTEVADIATVSNPLQKFPACSQSVEAMQYTVMHAQHMGKRCEKHKRWLMPYANPSLDALTAGLSRPLRPPFVANDCCICKTMS